MTGKMTTTTAMMVCLTVLLSVSAQEKDYSEVAGKEYLLSLNEKMSKLSTESSLAAWAYESNITDANLKNQLEVSAKVAKFEKEAWEETVKYPWRTFSDPDTRRQFQKYSVLGSAALSPDKFEKLEKIVKDMQGVYGKAKICDYHNKTKCSLHLEPEITELFASSRDPNELKHLWTEWRKASGRPVRCMYTEYVELTNEAAKLNNFTDASKSWLKDYESDDFTEQVEQLWQQLKPLYVQLHAYVRRRLREVYGEEVVSKTGPLPAHLLGNVWGQTWANILNDTVPYPDKPNTDVTPEMIAQKYTPLKMFKVAEEFFTSLGLSPMPETFWKNSIIEKPADGRDLICHASAWDFYDGKDFRIKQCTRVTNHDLGVVHHEMGHIQYYLQYKENVSIRIKQCTRVNKEDLETIHHEMGHVQYYLQYKNQPFVFKEGANPGFHEAVGDVMALSVSTPKHLRKIGLLKEYQDDEEAEINQLYAMALDKVAFLPFAYLMDQWRWAVFQGKITANDYNSKWWELREQYQGMQPPTQRDEDDFDPGAKYHIVASVPYIRYFVSFVIQFQFHRSLCVAAGEFDPQNPSLKPLHKCDIYQNKQAGELLGNMLRMGSSKPWPDAMEAITGQRKMDAGALLQYFSTLQTWLERENARTGEYIGWEPSSSSWDDGSSYLVADEPEDLFEDDNLGYSYAELVPRNDIAFDAPAHRERADPRFRHIDRRSTEDQFEVNKQIIRKFQKPMDNVAVKLTKISANQNEKVLRAGKGKFNGRVLEPRPTNTNPFHGGVDPVGRRGEGMRRRETDGKTSEDTGKSKQEEKPQGKEHSAFSKLLSSLGASMAKPHPAVSPAVSSEKQSEADSNSNLLWKAEVMKLQAETMLKSMEMPPGRDNERVNPVKENNDVKNYSKLSKIDHSHLSRPYMLEPELGATDLGDARFHHPGAKDDRRKWERDGVGSKSVAKKSYMHYHYNIRTPVFYNTVLVKKPKVNMWMDDDSRCKGGVSQNPEQELPYAVLNVRGPVVEKKMSDNLKSIKLVHVDQNRSKKFGESENVPGRRFAGDSPRGGRFRRKRRRRHHSKRAGGENGEDGAFSYIGRR